MKKFRSTGILFLLVVGVVSYAYFVEYRGKIQKTSQEATLKRIVPFSLDEISEFQIKTVVSEYLFKKVKDKNGINRWFLEKPVKDIANYGAVQGFLSQFGQESYEDVVAEGSNIDFSIYGLDENPNSMSFVRPHEGIDQVLKIEVGSVKALGGKTYLRLSQQDKVLLGGFFWESQFQKNFDDLREKNFIDPNFSIHSISIKNRENLNFENEDGKWVLKELSTNDPDQVQIDDIYYQINNLKASQIFKEGKKELDIKNLGLSDPEIVIEVTDKTSNKITISFSKNMTGQIYAISSERDVIFSLNPPAVKPFQKVVDDFRDKKKPLSFDLAKVEELDYKSSFTSFKLKKTDNEWKSVEDLGKMEVDNEKVVDLLSKLSSMKVKKYFDSGVDYQKSGASELVLKSSSGDKVLELEWSARPVGDVFVGKSNLSNKNFGLSLDDISSLPFQAVLKEQKAGPPKGEVVDGTKKDVQ